MSVSSDRLGTESIGKLLWQFAIPGMIASLVNALYNIVDRLYIGRSVGTDSMAGLTLTFPYMMILASFGVLVGAGSGALLSIKLGEGKKDDAEKIVGQCVALKLLFFATIPMLAYIFLDQTLVLFGGTATSIPPARDYLKIILLGNVFAHLAFGISALIRSEGNAKRSMRCMILGAVLNILLDPIFIFGGLGMPESAFFIDFGLPAMGIKGAAWATNIAMFISAVYAIAYFLSPKSSVKLRLSRIRIYPTLTGQVFSIGLSPCLLQMVASVVNITYNHAFIRWAVDAAESTRYIAAVGIVNGILMFGLMPVFGLTHGMQPIVGYNFGARKLGRMLKAYRLSMSYATAMCVLCMVTMQIFAEQMAWCFTKDPELKKTVVWGIRVLSAGFPFIGAPATTTIYFQSIGNASKAIWLSLMRQVLMLLPLIFLMPNFFGVRGVWFAGPTSDILSAVVIMTVVLFEFRRVKREMNKAPTV